MANYTVTNTNDSGEGSLRQAILNANANAGADTITFAGSTFTDSTPDTITLTSGQLSVTDSVTITGTGANLLTINGNNASRVFEFGGGGSKTYNLEGVTITGGNGVGNGTGFGGGINMNDGDDTLNIDRTVITGNTANSGGNTGGGLYVGFGTLNLTNSTVSNNTAGFAGGIRLQNLNASLSNVTVSGNSAVNTGGGIGHLATGTGRTSSLSLTNVTIANNSAAFGSALSNISQTGAVSAVTQYNNSIFANNTGSANIGNFGTGTVVQSLGYNISSDGSGNLTATGDLRNINPLLGSLQNNGGSTPTHALLPSSPAIGAGNTTLTTDQRGITRPQGAFDDIGAFELENAAPTNLVLNLSSIAENSPINTVVGSFVTTDPNRTDIYTYTFVGGASYPDNSLFTIDGSQLKANAVFDFESDNSYTIKVRTTDQNGLFDEKELTINITNVNETPTNLTLNNTSLAENSSVNSTIGTFSTTDPDTGDTFTYSLIPGNGDTDNNAFTIDGNQLKIKNSPNFETQSSYNIRVKTTDASGLSYQKALTISVNDLDIPTKLTTKDDDIFNITGDDTKATLQVTLTGSNSNLVNELGVFIVDDDTGKINGIAPGEPGYAQAALDRAQVIFSVLTNIPNGFNTTNITRLLELNSGDRLRFYLVKNSTTDAVLAGITPITEVLFSNTATQKVTNLGNDEFTLAWEDGSGASNFQDLVVKIGGTNQSLAVGTNLQGNSQAELIDLRTQTQLMKADFTVNREAAFDNFVGFYKITDKNGGIDTNDDGNADILPGQAGYTQAAVRGRVAGIDLTVSNQGTATLTGNFLAGAIYAPFIIANGRPDAILDSNANNDPAVYFSFLGANTDKVDHIRVLGDNIFGFEDLANGGDKDFNDLILRVNLSIA
ncbi:MAG: choice-of-anchor Q domain-containing protein [Nostoc sp. EkiNYC01]|nr:choice-of-anchor Q domain-containing protein [Nostoc sp. EkiNYC01]